MVDNESRHDEVRRIIREGFAETKTDNERVSDERLAELFEIHANSGPTTGAYMESNAEFVSILRDLLALRSSFPQKEEVEECRYCANTGWFYGDPDLQSFCGCAFGKLREDLYAQPTVPNAGEMELVRACERLLLHWDEFGPERYVEPVEGDDFPGYWSPAGRMVDTPFIAEVRGALSALVKP